MLEMTLNIPRQNFNHYNLSFYILINAIQFIFAVILEFYIYNLIQCHPVSTKCISVTELLLFYSNTSTDVFFCLYYIVESISPMTGSSTF